MKIFHFKKNRQTSWFLRQNQGFSLLELLIVIIIAVIISTVTFINFPLFSARQSLQISAEEVAQTIREAQIYGVAIKSSGNVTTPFPYYGIYLGTASGDAGSPVYPNKITVFADLNNDGAYNVNSSSVCGAVGNECIREYVLENALKLRSVCYREVGATQDKGYSCGVESESGSSVVVRSATVLFKRPNIEPEIKVNTFSGITTLPVSYVRLLIESPDSGDTSQKVKSVYVSRVGQIAVNDVSRVAVSTGGITCPYIFSWDGKEYVYEHRGLALSGIGRTQSNVRMLHAIKAEGGTLDLRVFEDFDETHLDEIAIYAIDIPRESSAVVYPDTFGNFHTFKDPLQPTTCLLGNLSCVEDVSLLDSSSAYFGVVTEKKGSPTSSDVILTFETETMDAPAKLLLKLKMDDSLYEVFPNLYKATGPIVFKVMGNDILRRIFKVDETLEKLALKVEVLDVNNNWVSVGNEIPSDLKDPEELLFDLSEVALPQTVQIRLASLFRYNLDYAALDPSPNEVMVVQKKSPSTALYRGVAETQDVKDVVAQTDNERARISAGNAISFSFKDPEPNDNTKRFYASFFNGYYLQKTPKSFSTDFNLKTVVNAFRVLQDSSLAPSYFIDTYAH